MFGLFVKRGASVGGVSEEKALSSVPAGRGGWFRIGEANSGDWQKNVSFDQEGALRHPFVFRCQSLIARDIAKLRPRVMSLADGGFWQAASNEKGAKLLRRPNDYQTIKQFLESWFLSKLARGNTYALLVRDNQREVVAAHILDPMRVQPLVSDAGDVFYRVSSDALAQVQTDIIVPARDIVHDRWNCLFHPLVGISPLWAAALAATQGQAISESSAGFFKKAARPSGLIVVPGKINKDDADRLRETFSNNHSGPSAGGVAVMGDGVSFVPMSYKAVDSQLIEQLKLTNETIATIYGVPHYKVGLAPIPAANNLQALNVEYYSQTLQSLIEDAEACLDLALGYDGEKVGVDFDIDGLLRMDSGAQMEVLEKGRSVLKLNERRKRLDLPPIEGGDTVYLQQQDHSIEAIRARDKGLIEGQSKPDPVPAPIVPDAPPPNAVDETKALIGLIGAKLMQGAK